MDISKSASEAASCSAIGQAINYTACFKGWKLVARNARVELSALHTARQKDAEMIASLTKQVSKLKHYAHHGTLCDYKYSGAKCNCGLAELLTNHPHH